MHRWCMGKLDQNTRCDHYTWDLFRHHTKRRPVLLKHSSREILTKADISNIHFIEILISCPWKLRISSGSYHSKIEWYYQSLSSANSNYFANNASCFIPYITSITGSWRDINWLFQNLFWIVTNQTLLIIEESKAVNLVIIHSSCVTLKQVSFCQKKAWTIKHMGLAYRGCMQIFYLDLVGMGSNLIGLSLRSTWLS